MPPVRTFTVVLVRRATNSRVRTVVTVHGGEEPQKACDTAAIAAVASMRNGGGEWFAAETWIGDKTRA